MKRTQKKILVDGIGKTMLCANAFHAILVDFIDQKKRLCIESLHYGSDDISTYSNKATIEYFVV